MGVAHDEHSEERETMHASTLAEVVGGMIALLAVVTTTRYRCAMAISICIATAADDRAACFDLRKVVFVDEQHVPLALEIEDDEDRYTHFIGRDERGYVVATARLKVFVDKDGRTTAKAQRVAVAKRARGTGAGRAVMQALQDEGRRRGAVVVVLSAQVAAVPFYERLGYAAHGPVYDDAGIPHRDMTLALPSLTAAV